MISPSASTNRESTAPQIVGRRARIIHETEVITVATGRPSLIRTRVRLRSVTAKFCRSSRVRRCRRAIASSAGTEVPTATLSNNSLRTY